MKFAHSRILSILLLAGFAMAEEIDLRVEIASAGVHEISASEILPNSALEVEAPTFESLVLTWNEKPLHIWSRDENNNGLLDQDDAIVFLAPSISMDLASREAYPTVFRLKAGNNSSAGMLGLDLQVTAVADDSDAAPLLLRTALEEDRFRSGFMGSDSSEADHFYWLSASSLDVDSTPIFAFHDLPIHELIDPTQVSVAFAFRGPTRIADRKIDIPDHSIEIEIDGTVVGRKDWYGTFEQNWEAANLTFQKPDSELTYRIHRRETPAEDHVADIVYLNHVVTTAPLSGPVPSDLIKQVPVTTGKIGENSGSRQISTSGSSAALYLEKGLRWKLPATGGSFRIEVENLTEEILGFLSFSGQEKKPESVAPWPKPDFSELLSDTTDSLLIAPEQFINELKPLMSLQSERGHRPLAVSTNDIFNTFGSGIPSREAIRSAIAAWFGGESGDGPKFVLLVGDASSEPIGQGRNLIPTWELQLRGVLCASDHLFGCVEGDDETPNLAIGRLPVASLEELRATMGKITQATTNSDASRQHLEYLWVVDHEGNNRANAEALIANTEEEIAKSRTVFVEESETNTDRMTRFKNELKSGPDVVFYCGHGARHYWRTGPVDYKGQSSLFSSDDLSEIAEFQPFPPARVVFTLTCDSAPFDHPKEDTLGERFVTVPGGGSQTFIGPSWKVQNDFRTVGAFAEAIAESKTVGEAFLLSKRRLGSRRFNEAYNLLGDPTTPIR